MFLRMPCKLGQISQLDYDILFLEIKRIDDTKDKEGIMDGFTFPTNVKQIGSIGEGLRIYIEDYAYSYLQQYTSAQGYDTKLAFLVGRSMVIDSQEVLFISGVVRGLHTDTERGMVVFTHKSFEHARKDINRYFSGLEIVGWMQSQPGFGLRLLPAAEEYHFKTFPDRAHVCMIMDSEEKMNAFYVQDTDGIKLAEMKGYFIYYDKNRGMHEYMLDNKTTRIKVFSAEGKGIRDTSQDMQAEDFDDNSNMLPSEVAVQRIRRNYLQRNGSDTAFVSKEERRAGMFGKDMDDEPRHIGRELVKAGSIMSSASGGTSRYSQPKSQRRIVNLLMSFCGILLVVSLALGAGLLQNIERIDVLEQQVGNLAASHRSLLADVTNSARPVFAENHISASAEEQVSADQITADSQTDEVAEVIAQEPVAAMSSPVRSAVNIDELISQLQNTNQPNEAPSQTLPNPPHQSGMPPQTMTVYPDEVALPQTPFEYVVVAGDSLSLISTIFFGSTARVAEIMELNSITNPDEIRVGDTLLLPRR